MTLLRPWLVKKNLYELSLKQLLEHLLQANVLLKKNAVRVGRFAVNHGTPHEAHGMRPAQRRSMPQSQKSELYLWTMKGYIALSPI
jgi:hypothetical protein